MISNHLSEVESRTQGSRARPRTDPLEAKAKDQGTDASILPKKKGPQKFFLGILKKISSKIFFRQKKSSKIFFRGSLLEETTKKVFPDFPQGFWCFLTKFQRFKSSVVLEPRTRQFSRTGGLEAKAKDFKMCPRGQGRPRGFHLCHLLHLIQRTIALNLVIFYVTKYNYVTN